MSFKEILAKRAKEASMLPSFPQKSMQYNIDIQKTTFAPIDDWTKQENAFGKMVERKQTLYTVITKEGVLRISPNQVQQLQDVLSAVEFELNQQYVLVETSTEAALPLKFFLVQ
jgi:hypothetical protein